MASHRFSLPDLDPDAAVPGTVIGIGGDEGRHAARVKRLGEGDAVELLNGRGLRAGARVLAIEKAAGGHGKPEWVVRVEVESAAVEERIRPALRVLASAPKGPRLEEMIDQLSQVGAAGWSPLVTSRTVVQPREGKLQRAERISAESAKQCGRAWGMEIGGGVRFEDALVAGEGRVVIADASGAPYESDGAAAVTLLVGPEGGFTEDEQARAREAGAGVCRFGVHVMRVETAAVVAAGIVMDAERRSGGA